MTPLKIPWKRIAVEAIAIVVSILLAFAIDTWWDDRQSRIDEQQILLGLHAEFTTNREILSQDLGSGTLNALLGSGRLEILRNRELRMLEDPRLLNLLDIRIGFKEHLTGELETAIKAADQIIQAIDASFE